MKIKCARRKSSQKKFKTVNRADPATTTAESEVQLDVNEEDDTGQRPANALGLNIKIKEEPELCAINEQHNSAQSTEGAGINIKQESDAELEPDFTPALVKNERDGEEKIGSQQLQEYGEDAENNQNSDGEEDDGEGDSQFFPCPHCDVSFTKWDFLEKHIKWVHQKEYLDDLKNCLSSKKLSPTPKHSCTDCSSTFNSKVALRAHAREAHPSAPPRRLHPCPTCARSFQYLKNLRNHCQSCHDMSVVTRGGHLSCGDCGKSFEKTWGQDTLEFHPCLYCDTSFTNAIFLQHHVTYQHSEQYTDRGAAAPSRLRVR
ncbi:hypothetical protein CRUP_004799 [Coryphaenoides rupestris]|nr:hypothetical protein CRUP_004799 [Coryphaenoides rupestris]